MKILILNYIHYLTQNDFLCIEYTFTDDIICNFNAPTNEEQMILVQMQLLEIDYIGIQQQNNQKMVNIQDSINNIIFSA